MASDPNGDTDKQTARDEGTPRERTPNLYQRICAVMADVERIDKTGRNTHFGFDFIEQSMVMAALRPKMALHGLVLIPSIDEVDGSGKNVRVKMTFTLANADDPGDTLAFSWFAEGQDTTDKGIVKAVVQAQKYALMKLFMLSDKDDPDADGPAPEGHAAGQRASSAPTQVRTTQAMPVSNGQRQQRPATQQPMRSTAPAAAVQPGPPVGRVAATPGGPPAHSTLDRVAGELAAATAGAHDGHPTTRTVDDAKRDLKEACLRVGLPVPASVGALNPLAARYGVPVVGSSAGVTVDWLDRIRAALPDIPVGPLDKEHMTETATALEELRATCRTLGRDEPRSLAQLNELATQIGLGGVSSWQTVSTRWLEALRASLQRQWMADRAPAPGTQAPPEDGGTVTEGAERSLAGWIAAAPDGATLDQLKADVMRALKAGTLTEGAAEALLEAVHARGAELAAANLYPPGHQDLHEAAEQSGVEEVEAATAG